MSEERFYQIVVKRNGDISLSSLAQNNTGFREAKTYAIRTFGTIENRGNQAFYNLILSGNQIHNFGTIQTYSYHFFHNYSFNSGIIKNGEIPEGVIDLMEGRDNSRIKPIFKENVIENYGLMITKGKVAIRDGLSYHEHNESVVRDIEMSGGDIRIYEENANITGTLEGEVRDISIVNNSALYIGRMIAKQTGEIKTENGGILYRKDEYKAELEQSIRILQRERDNLEALKEDKEVYNRYLGIKSNPGKVLNSYQINQYKKIYTDEWEEAAALGWPYGLKGGGGAVSIVGGLALGAIVGSASHGHTRVALSSNGNVRVTAGNSRRHIEETMEVAERIHENRADPGRMLQEATVTHMDIASLWGDPYLELVTHWDRVKTSRKERLEKIYPEIGEITDTIEEARRIPDLSEYLDTPGRTTKKLCKGIKG